MVDRDFLRDLGFVLGTGFSVETWVFGEGGVFAQFGGGPHVDTLNVEDFSSRPAFVRAMIEILTEDAYASGVNTGTNQ